MNDKMKFEEYNNQYELTDSEDEYSEDERALLKEVRKNGKNRNNAKLEVMAFEDSDNNDDSDGGDNGNGHDNDDADLDSDDISQSSDKKSVNISSSDIDGDENEEQNLSDLTNWGNKSRYYYNTDFIDPDFSTYNEKEAELAKQEEEEAKRIQLRLASQMNEDDFVLDGSQAVTEATRQPLNLETTSENKKKIKSDFETLSKRERFELFVKDSPEFLGLSNDFEVFLQNVKTILNPILRYVNENNVPNVPAIKFANTYRDLSLTYCSNISLYLLLKAKHVSLKYHPLTKRLIQLKRLIKQLHNKYENFVKPQLDVLMVRIRNGDSLKELKLEGVQDIKNSGRHKKDKVLTDMTDTFADAIPDEIDDDSRRSITYQIAKNKGLTPNRKKELRNPRVKHRNKFRKALIRRKGAVRTARTETKRYDGEISGIKTTVVKSVKFKT